MQIGKGKRKNMGNNEKETATQVKLYTANEIVEKIKKIHAKMIADESSDEETDSQMVLIDLIAGAKLVQAIQDAIENGQF